MKRLIAAFALSSALGAGAVPTVENLKAKQQYPWNNTVDVSYTLGGSIDGTACYGLSFAYVTQDGTTNTIKSLDRKIHAATPLGAVTTNWTAEAGISERDCTFCCRVSPANPDWMIVDLVSGVTTYANYDLDTATNVFNTTEYKTTKMVFRLVPAASGVTLQYGTNLQKSSYYFTNDYYIGLFEVTEAQYKTLVPNDYSAGRGDEYPMTALNGEIFYSWANPVKVMRGGETDNAVPGIDFAQDSTNAFIALLNKKIATAMWPSMATFDLPTEAMWEYAARGGAEGQKHCTWDWFFDETSEALGDYAWYSENSDNAVHSVGEKLCNPLGLFDVYGNVWEMCRDTTSGDGEDFRQVMPEDGLMGATLRSRYWYCHHARGGACNVSATDASSTSREFIDYWHPDRGFRLARIVRE